jgi:hypothetical protein
MKFVSNNWQGIVAFLALLISTSSAIISFYTFRLQRTHNIKSVKPILHIGQWDYENNLSVTLVNLGLGLALIETISVSNKTDIIKNCIYNWLPQKLPGNMNYKEYWTGYKNFVVQPGQIIKLVEIPIDANQQEQIEYREKIRAILRQLTVRIKYHDIYENEMPKKEMELFHFSRTDNENSNA